MTEFEAASLAVAEATLTAMRMQMWALLASVLVAVVAAAVAIRALMQLVGQVKAAVDANSIGQLAALLSLEQDMSRRRDRFGEINRSLHTAMASEEYRTNRHIADPLVKQFEEAEENYLNALDRLCFCIVRGKFSEDELRADYRNVIRSAINDFPKRFGAASPFRNILKLHDRWADS